MGESAESRNVVPVERDTGDVNPHQVKRRSRLNGNLDLNIEKFVSFDFAAVTDVLDDVGGVFGYLELLERAAHPDEDEDGKVEWAESWGWKCRVPAASTLM